MKGCKAECASYLAGEQALQKGLPLVASAVQQVLQSGHRPVREGVQVLGKAALYDACTNRASSQRPCNCCCTPRHAWQQLFLATLPHQEILSQTPSRMVYPHVLHDTCSTTSFTGSLLRHLRECFEDPTCKLAAQMRC